MEKLKMPKISCIVCVVVFIMDIISVCCGVTYKVREEGSPNYFIGNIVEDFNLTSHINEGKSLRFSFLNQDEVHVSFFNISENSGNLYTVGILDREKICEFSSECDILLEIAVTASKDSFFQKLKVTVTIEDINDHTPIFPVPSVDIPISESVVVGTSITTDGAIDPDSFKFSIKSYNITTPGSPFSTNFSKNLDGSSSVQIIVNEGLDREKVDRYEIQVVAIDGGSPPKTGTLLLNITVTDTNDNFPVFSNPIYNITVKEDILINSTVLQVIANDFDIGSNGEITYGLATHQSQDIKDLFQIDPLTGEIQTIGRLVYSPDHQYTIIIEASDAGTQPHTTQAFVYVQVQDVENNPPKIKLNTLSSSNFSKVSELANVGAVVALIAVSDDDVGWNGITNCSLQSDLFALQRSELNEYKVIVSKHLDRELKDFHLVTVFCEDIGTPPLNSSKSLNISVIDENDHTPIFSTVDNTYSTEIPENNNYGDVILTVVATDKDYGENSKIRYELQGDAWSYFTIEPTDGVIHAMKVFDREEKGLYQFHVLAIDGGEEPRTATATVTLNIIDLNDNKPQFEMQYYEFEIAENMPKDTKVDQVIAIDKDADNNGIVTYMITQQHEITVPFKLTPDGVLKSKKPLDRELKSRYDFTIIATDQGSPYRQNSSVNISVFVIDVNDNSPFFITPKKSGHVIQLSLSTPVNTPLYLVKAFDHDDGRNSELIFTIEDRNDTNIFDINDLGQILVARTIESWEVNLYMIEVAVYDNGNTPNFAKTKLMMSVQVSNNTNTTGKDSGLHNQNLLIALTVVIVTVVLAATIVVTICVIRRMDKKKQEFFGADTNSDSSSEAEAVPGLVIDAQKDFYSRPPSNNVQLTPVVVPHLNVDGGSTTKDYIYKPRMNTPTPSTHSTVDGNNPSMQLQQHTEAQDTSTPRLNRLASLRLHQALIQSHDKQWTNHNDSQQSNEIYPVSRPGAEDTHSQASGDGDSGRGGSVSDGHSNMGISHDSDDIRILQLQNLVRQSGRRGTPPHLQKEVAQSHINDDHYHPQKHHDQSQCQKTSNITPRDNQTRIQNQSNSHSNIDQSENSRNSNLNSNYQPTNSDLMYSDRSEKHNKQRYPSFNENNSNRNTNYNQNCQSPRGKINPGIQMGLSSIANQYNPHPYSHKDNLSSFRPQSLRRPSCDNRDSFPHGSRYVPDQHNNAMHNNRQLDETLDSITTTAYDDDDNTTTSGSYTIDNNAAEDFVELNAQQLKDIFV